MKLKIKKIIFQLRTTYYALRTNRGFTLLLAALVASITLSIGVSIFEITQKQVILSSLGRDSQFAFYTADTGAECALYWDVRHNAFSTTTPITPITCDSTADGSPNIDVSSTDTASYPVYFNFQFEPGGLCAEVVVTKQLSNPQTVIHSDGFNTNCASIAASPRSLQRSVEIRY